MSRLQVEIRSERRALCAPVWCCRRRLLALVCVLLIGGSARLTGAAAVLLDTTTPHHHIRVIDQAGLRFLSFDGSTETRMSLADANLGHFEYTEYFRLPWLWNPALTNTLMIGLGGASTQRAYQRLWPHITVESVELDPMVVQVAKRFFHFSESPTQRVHIEDGRVFLRRATTRFGAILVDAYQQHRYGPVIPYHLATLEFFELASTKLSTNGVLAYNVIGTLQGYRAPLVGAVYQTMKKVFPQVYLCPAQESLNVVLIGTLEKTVTSPQALRLRAVSLQQQRRVTFPTFLARVQAVRAQPPPAFLTAPILTDEFNPLDRLAR